MVLPALVGRGDCRLACSQATAVNITASGLARPMSSCEMISRRLQAIVQNALDEQISSAANSIASRSIPLRMHFCMAEMQTIALRSLIVVGIMAIHSYGLGTCRLQSRC